MMEIGTKVTYVGTIQYQRQPTKQYRDPGVVVARYTQFKPFKLFGRTEMSKDVLYVVALDSGELVSGVPVGDMHRRKVA